MVKKIHSIKLANSVKAGTSETNFLTEKDYDITITDNVVIDITQKSSGQSVSTSIFNTVWWIDSKIVEAPAKKNAARPKD